MSKWSFLLSLLLLVCGVAQAQQADNLEQLVTHIRAETTQTKQALAEREQHFLAAKNQQQQLVDKAEQRLAQLKREEKKLQAESEQLSSQLEQSRKRYQALYSQLQQVYSVARDSANTLLKRRQVAASAALHPDREQQLARLSRESQLPTLGQLQTLWLDILGEIADNARVSQIELPVVEGSGVAAPAKVSIVGPFSAYQPGEYLTQHLGKLQQVSQQPDWRDRMRTDEKLKDGLQMVAVDPSGGQLLGWLQASPSVWQRLQQGGVIGYIILFLGLAGAVIAVVKLVQLQLTGRRLDRQLKDLGQPRQDNPLGRVMQAWQQAHKKGAQEENLELRLDEAVMQEVPRLEYWQPTVRLLAAVAPMLGLLGTVAGMIQTFQAITLHGSGDPKLMASGISQALVTTVLGLIVAIPLLFAHTAMTSTSRRYIRVLDQQSTGLLAEYMERQSKGTPP